MMTLGYITIGFAIILVIASCVAAWKTRDIDQDELGGWGK